MFYPKHRTGDGAISASLDLVSPAATVEGWARYQASHAVCHIQIRLNGEVVAEDIADHFRHDLLEAGLGHGHYAFYAKLRPLPPGYYDLQLFDGRSGAHIDTGQTSPCFVPQFDPAQLETVETLLRPRRRWTGNDLLRNCECLQLDYNFQVMGPSRFIDRLFRFALGRWADREGARHYADALISGEMSPKDVLSALLRSSERQQQTRQLPRPMDPDFPFILDPASPE